MPKLINVSIQSTFTAASTLTGYSGEADSFDGDDIEAYLRQCIPVVAVSYNTDTNVILMTLACGDIITGTVVGGGGEG